MPGKGKVMRKVERVDRRQQKIDQILALMRGEIKPSDVIPRYEITFIDDNSEVFMINKKIVNKERFIASIDEFLPYPQLITCHGRGGDNSEFYL